MIEQSLHLQNNEKTLDTNPIPDTTQAPSNDNNITAVRKFPFFDQDGISWDFPVYENVVPSLQEFIPASGGGGGANGAKKHETSPAESLWDEGSVTNYISVDGGSEKNGRVQELVTQDDLGSGGFLLDTRQVSDCFDKGRRFSDLMQADLDQLYFDRMHSFAPFVHQRTYLTWRQDTTRSDSQKCLQYAMWTLASSVSAHYRDIGDDLYRCTRSALEILESKNTVADVDQVQAWLLLAIHEFICVDFHRGWMSSGRAFRFIQLHWLHGLDDIFSQKDWIERERQCRTFWTVYCLDRFISMHTRTPLTFTEQILIRLPMPESAFQNEQPVQMGFLPEALTDGSIIASSSTSSSFIEGIVVATMCGRAISHRLQSTIDERYLNDGLDFCTRYQWLSSSLVLGMEAFSLRYSSTAQQDDPMLFFISMMWQTTMLDLCKTMQSAVLPPIADERNAAFAECAVRSSNAAQEMVGLANKLSQLNFLKLHPLMPIPLSLCTEFLVVYPELQASFTQQLKRITEAIPHFKIFKRFADSFRNP